MSVLTKYTLLLGALLAIVLAPVAWYRVEHLRAALVADTARDHRTVGHLLQAGVADIWLDAGRADGDRARATAQTERLIQRANDDGGPTRFAWLATAGAVESQRVEGGDFVSRFPVRSTAEPVGAVVARERLIDIDRLVRAQLLETIASIASIVVLGMLASWVLGRWLMGRPIALLVQEARRIGRRELTGEPAFRRSDELGELAVELSAASRSLAAALAASSAETEARVRAVEQLRHSDRLSTVGTLAAGIAHELGTPLSIVAGHAQMIAGGEVTGGAALDSARAIDREVTRIGGIVRQLLDFARRKGPEGTACDPAAVARRCVALIAPMAERGRVACTVEVDEPAPRASIDEDALQQVLTNLVVNAVQAMPGGGALRIAIARSPDGPHGAGVRLDVRDTGGGIPDDARAHIFEPFFTTKRAGDGTGLGLAVVHGIVADHRGAITVETGPRGTTFSIFLHEEPP